MREMGLEPTRPIGHKILSLACLPISALPRDKVYISTAEAGWQQLFSFSFFAPELLRLPGVGRGQTPGPLVNYSLLLWSAARRAVPYGP